MLVMTSGGNDASFGVVTDLCVYHSKPTHNYGPAYKDDKDRTGDCAKALDQSSEYIENTLQNDLITKIKAILLDPNVKNNPDFLLYLTGYARFFGTDMDPWCNEEAWNVPSLAGSPVPYLSVELRNAFNDRVAKVNDIYKNTIEQYFFRQARYIDLDGVFSGHRFCEPGANHGDQLNTDTHFDKVYLWNLNWPWQVSSNVPAPDPKDPNHVTGQDAAKLFADGHGVTAWGAGTEGSSNGENKPSNGWRLRPFHPRYTGYTSIKNQIIAQLKKDGLPKAKASSPPPPPPPPPPPAYAPGTCSFHLDEWQNCADDASNLFAQITMYDNNKVNIGQTNVVPFKNPLGDPINAGSPLDFQSKLPFALQVTGEHEDDYVQFNYNGLQWQSKSPSGGASCKVGGWDPRDGPRCVRPESDAVSLRFPPRKKSQS